LGTRGQPRSGAFAKNRLTPQDRETKANALRALQSVEIRDIPSLIQFHEILCFLRAYPDSPDVLCLVERREKFCTLDAVQRARPLNIQGGYSQVTIIVQGRFDSLSKSFVGKEVLPFYLGSYRSGGCGWYFFAGRATRPAGIGASGRVYVGARVVHPAREMIAGKIGNAFRLITSAPPKKERGPAQNSDSGGLPRAGGA
jgi:hypothetical protein